jgi:ubiquinone/menaquinone biosynthesis C-methylase UbiE
VPEALERLLACPACLEGGLAGLPPRGGDGKLTCRRCGEVYEVRGGLPILLPPGAAEADAHDELDHSHKRRQAGWFDRSVAERFEVERPHGAPRAYRWLLGHKLDRALAKLPPLGGATVVDACCGSGMEAEYLARRGAKVLAVDLSEGAARRAMARAAAFRLDYLVVVGDAERLPVRSAAADVGFVHDGLHHLDDPLVGVRELARVARAAVSVNEPAAALLTQAAVALGLALEREEAGNPVRRLRPAAVARVLEAAGFAVQAERYLLYYGHEPGRGLRLASAPGAYAAFRLGVAAANLAASPLGNKLCLTGVRPHAAPGPPAAA